MSLDTVRVFLAEKAPDIAIQELSGSTATVAMAAAGFGVEPAQIAKTLALVVNGSALLVVTGGDARLNNQKAKAVFGGKARMMTREEVEMATGHRRYGGGGGTYLAPAGTPPGSLSLPYGTTDLPYSEYTVAKP